MKTVLLGLTVATLILTGASNSEGQVKSLVIGIDGLGFGDFGFSVASTPNMDSLITGSWQAGYQGAYSDSAFAGGNPELPETLQATSSGPGWSTILTGVWVDQHGVPNNSFSSPDYTNNPTYLATLKSALPSLTTATFINWSPIDSFIIQSIDDDADPNNDVDFRSGGNDAIVAQIAASNIAGSLDPDAIFIHFDEVDGAGHSFGAGSPNFAAEITNTDMLVGQVLTAVANRPNFANEDWQIIVTSDHGHTLGGGHGGQSDLERTIPFIVASKNLNQGNLPLDFPQRVSHADVAPTVLDHFGIAVPSHYYGVSRADGAFFGSADINGDGSVTGDGTGTFANDDVAAFVSLWLQENTTENPNPADINLDGIADLGDWAILNAENPAMGAALIAALRSQTVPEPSTWLLLIAVVVWSPRCKYIA